MDRRAEMEREIELQREWGLMQKGQFGAAMGLAPRTEEGVGGDAFVFSRIFDVDVVFVRTPEEAETFPDNVLVGFPTEQTEASLRALNFWVEVWIEEKGHVLPEGFELPLTMDDLIDRQDAMKELFFSLDVTLRRDISVGHPAPNDEE